MEVSNLTFWKLSSDDIDQNFRKSDIKSIQDVDFKTEKVYEDSLSSTRKIIEHNDLILIIFIVDCLNPKVTCDHVV